MCLYLLPLQKLLEQYIYRFHYIKLTTGSFIQVIIQLIVLINPGLPSLVLKIFLFIRPDSQFKNYYL